MTYYIVSLFIYEKMSQDAETGCEIFSTLVTKSLLEPPLAAINFRYDFISLSLHCEGIWPNLLYNVACVR